ncbi:MAG TPA: DUF6252 family protein [Flavobacterium sp.]|jgi:hypothetical protein|nr:DUF6252 family protein [Flavobacterium sp.]
MKKFVLLMTLTLALGSCAEDITRNDPSLQGVKDDVNWRAGGATAMIDENGGLTISGGNQFETLILQTPSTEPGTYVLGENENSQAFFIYESATEAYSYSTGTNNDEGGQIIIEEYNTATRTISGTFRFNALNDDAESGAADVLNFQYGVFYHIPIVAGVAP